jgi:predicted O-methyltransferase YrrM
MTEYLIIPDYDILLYMTTSKIIKEPLKYNEEKVYEDHEIEESLPISQNQLDGGKLFNSKYEYVKTLKKNISYLEVGVAWGYSAQMIIDTTNAKSADLLDRYDNAHGVLHPGGPAPEDSSMTHEQYIKNKFAYHPNVNTIKGDAKDVLPTLIKKYDFILLDIDRDRIVTRKYLENCSKLTNLDGVIGLTSYMNYDSILYPGHVGIFQSVNEFLYFNKNWSVDGLLINTLGFHDIYIKRNL